MNVVLTFFDENGRTFVECMEGIFRFASKSKWHIENIGHMDRDEDIRSILDFWKPIGCIVEGGNETRMTRASFGSIPVVFMNRQPLRTDKNASLVRMNDRACAEAAIDELAKGGPAHYAFVPFRVPSAYWSKAREAAFSDILARRNVKFSSFSPTGDRGEFGRTEFVRQLRPWIKTLPKPCGIFAANDTTASMTAMACAMESIRIPEDASIIGVDDDKSVCCNILPNLSSVHPDKVKGGYLAAKLLSRAIRNPKWKGRQVEYTTNGVSRRGSTRILTRKDSEVDAALWLIEQKACSGLSVREVHGCFRCSGRLADIRFQAITHKTVLEAIHEVRLAKVRALLSDPDQDLEPIANLCGYTNRNSLCKFFKAKTGLTLSAWRRRHLGK